MIDTQGLAKMLMGTWDQTKQPLKHRYSALPLGEYEDGSLGPAVPSLLAAPVEGVMNFGKYGYGEDAVPYNAMNAFDAAGGAMTGGLATGLAGGMVDNALGSAGGRVARAAERQPQTFYRGVSSLEYPIEDHGFWWGSNSRRVAEEYAFKGDPRSGVIPTEYRFSNPMEVKAGGARFDRIPFEGKLTSTDDLAMEARSRGHDGLYVYNVVDGMRADGSTPPSTVAAALKRGTAFDPTTGDLLYANAKPGAAVPLAVQSAEQQAPKGIRAYHGSPHDFDKFSLDKIGTGEGAQVYGHGLYFAEAEDVARSYRDALGMVGSAHSLRVNGQPFDGSNPIHIAADELANAVDVNDAIARLQGFADKTDGETAALYKDAAEHLRTHGAPEYSFDDGFSGRMYEVNINADPADFLDWDQPLSQQSEKVRSVLGQFGDDATGEKAWQDYSASLVNRDTIRQAMPHTGNDLFQLAKWLASAEAKQIGPRDASQALREAGIPGIRYLDGASRGAGEGTANYVVFDDQLIDILRKYANAPTGAALPLGLEAQQDQQDLDPALMEVLRQYGLMPSN